MSDLTSQSCKPLPSGTPALTAERAQELLGQLDGWAVDNAGPQLWRRFKFDNFHCTMAFVNALAWVAHQEDHHPDMELGYNYCVVRFSTHSIGGLSDNDFICAAKIDALL